LQDVCRAPEDALEKILSGLFIFLIVLAALLFLPLFLFDPLYFLHLAWVNWCLILRKYHLLSSIASNHEKVALSTRILIKIPLFMPGSLLDLFPFLSLDIINLLAVGLLLRLPRSSVWSRWKVRSFISWHLLNPLFQVFAFVVTISSAVHQTFPEFSFNTTRNTNACS